MTDKRHFIRHDAIHLIDYLEVYKDGSFGTYSMGRTLDVSNNGLQLETTLPIPPGTTLELTVGIADDLVDLKGRVIHCRTAQGRYVSGISFAPLEKEGARVLGLYMQAFNQRKRQNKLQTQAE